MIVKICDHCGKVKVGEETKDWLIEAKIMGIEGQPKMTLCDECNKYCKDNEEEVKKVIMLREKIKEIVASPNFQELIKKLLASQVVITNVKIIKN